MNTREIEAILDAVRTDPETGYILLRTIPQPFRSQFAADSAGSTCPVVQDAEGIIRHAHYFADWIRWKSYRVAQGIEWQPRFGRMYYQELTDEALDADERQWTERRRTSRAAEERECNARNGNGEGDPHES